MNLGERIYHYRTGKNMSQGDLADALEVSRQSVSKWENNTAVPELDKLLKLADIFEVSLDELAGRAGSKKESSAGRHAIEVKTTFEKRELIGMFLIGAGILLAVLGFLVPDIEAEAGFYFALALATAGVACIWQLNHPSNWIIFTLDGFMSVAMATVNPQSALITAIPFIVVFIVQCTRYLNRMQEENKQEEEA